MFYNKIAFGQEVSFKLTTLRQESIVEEVVEETTKPELKFDFFDKVRSSFKMEKMSEFFNKPFTTEVVEEKEEEAISESSQEDNWSMLDAESPGKMPW